MDIFQQQLFSDAAVSVNGVTVAYSLLKKYNTSFLVTFKGSERVTLVTTPSTINYSSVPLTALATTLGMTDKFRDQQFVTF
jgi:hypothetical protein